MLKSQEISYPDSTFNKAKTDEPLFIIRPTDKFAAKTVRDWAARVSAESGVNPTKVSDALALASQIEDWQELHGCKVPD